MRRLSIAKTISLGAMATALTVLSLYAASVLPTGHIALYFISSLFVYVLASERAYIGALVSFAASAALSLIVLPSKGAGLWAYIALLGHYGIFRSFIDGALKDRLLKLLLRLIYCNIMTGGAICIAVFLLGLSPSFEINNVSLPVWAMILILEAGFAVFDFLYWICQRIYDERLKYIISPRR